MNSVSASRCCRIDRRADRGPQSPFEPAGVIKRRPSHEALARLLIVRDALAALMFERDIPTHNVKPVAIRESAYLTALLTLVATLDCTSLGQV